MHTVEIQCMVWGQRKLKAEKILFKVFLSCCKILILFHNPHLCPAMSSHRWSVILISIWPHSGVPTLEVSLVAQMVKNLPAVGETWV